MKLIVNFPYGENIRSYTTKLSNFREDKNLINKILPEVIENPTRKTSKIESNKKSDNTINSILKNYED